MWMESLSVQWCRALRVLGTSSISYWKLARTLAGSSTIPELNLLKPQPCQSTQQIAPVSSAQQVKSEAREVSQLCRYPVMGWPDAPPGCEARLFQYRPTARILAALRLPKHCRPTTNWGKFIGKSPLHISHRS